MAAVSSICPRCGRQNAARMRFCVACGSGLAAAAGSGSEPMEIVRTIARHAGPADDAAQQERIARLIEFGAPVIPVINGAIWSAIRYAGTPAEIENAGLLCQVVGRIGGPQAHTTLERLAVHTAASDRCRPIHDGVCRGLDALPDERARALSAHLESLAQRAQTPDLPAAAQDAPASDTLPAAAEGEPEPVRAAPETSPARTGADPWTWVIAIAALFYLALIVLVFIAPQVSFVAGTVLLAPPVLYLVLLRLHATGWIDRSPSGCMLILASFAGGLLLYGLLWLVQRAYFIAAFEALMDSGS